MSNGRARVCAGPAQRRARQIRPAGLAAFVNTMQQRQQLGTGGADACAAVKAVTLPAPALSAAVLAHSRPIDARGQSDYPSDGGASRAPITAVELSIPLTACGAAAGERSINVAPHCQQNEAPRL